MRQIAMVRTTHKKKEISKIVLIEDSEPRVRTHYSASIFYSRYPEQLEGKRRERSQFR
jgi:hypothetical protein